MNLIQLSEQLKDVPDSFLQNEVTNPTGAYPAYLVVSELTRRKRMRDNVAKQEPGTTVAEDVMGLNAIPQAMQSLAAQDVAMAGPPQQMPRQPQRMPMPPRPQPQPQQMADGGLVAFDNGGSVTIEDTQEELEEFQPPVESMFTKGLRRLGADVEGLGKDAEELARRYRGAKELPGRFYRGFRKLFSTDPRELEQLEEEGRQADIRVGEFGKEFIEEPTIRVGRNIIRDRSGNIIPSGPEGRLNKEYLDDEEKQKMRERIASSPEPRDAVLRSIEGYRIDNLPTKSEKVSGTTHGIVEESARVQRSAEKYPEADIISRQSGKLTGTENLNLDKPNPEQKEVGNAPDENNPKITKIGQASKLKLENLKSSFKTDLDNINRVNKDISKLLSKGKAPDELYQEGVDKYKKEIKNPLKFLKDEIQKEEKRIEKLKFDNLNDALIQAGAAILQSPGGQNLQWLGKGLEGFQKAYKEGRKDIVDAKKDLLQSRIAFAESENDYARGAEEAGLRSLQRGETFQTMGLQKLGTEKALFAENINTALSIAQAESGIAKDFAQAYYYRNPQLRTSGIEGELSAKQQEMVYNEVRRDMADYANRLNITPSDPRYREKENQLLDEKTQRIMLRNRGIYGSLGQGAPRSGTYASIVDDPLAPKTTAP